MARTKVADRLRRLLEELDLQDDMSNALHQVADAIDADHEERMRRHRDSMLMRFCRDARSFFNGYERNMRRRYLMQDVMKGDAEMQLGQGSVDSETLMRAYDDSLELYSMLRGNTNKPITNDMVTRAESIHKALRQIVPYIMGMQGKGNVIYRDVRGTGPFAIPEGPTDFPRTAEVGDRHYKYVTTTMEAK